MTPQDDKLMQELMKRNEILSQVNVPEQPMQVGHMDAPKDPIQKQGVISKLLAALTPRRPLSNISAEPIHPVDAAAIGKRLDEWELANTGRNSRDIQLPNQTGVVDPRILTMLKGR